MTDVVLWTIYIIGVVLTPFIAGATLMGKGRYSLSVFDEGIPLFIISLFWPVVIALLVVGAAIFSLLWIPGKLWILLMDAGRRVARGRDCDDEGTVDL